MTALKFRVFVLLARERLHDAHACDVLCERRRHEAQALADGAIRAGGADAEDHGRDAHEWDDRQRREREPPVEDEEEDRRADQREAVLDEARDAVGDELVDRLDVVRQPADDHARAGALVETEGEPLEMAEEPGAQVGQDALADPAREVSLHVAHGPVEEAGDDERPDDPPEQTEVVLADGVVDRELCEEGRRQRRHRRREQRDDGERGARLVRLGQPGELCDSPTRPTPGPVVDLDLLDRAEVTPRLPDPHGR